MKARTLKLLVAMLAFAFTLAACSSDEAAGGHGTPETVKLFNTTTNTELTQPYALPSGTDYAGDGALLRRRRRRHQPGADRQWSLHVTHLRVGRPSPRPRRVTGEVFQHDVTVFADPGATSTVTIGYGHDAAADERAPGGRTRRWRKQGAPALRTR